MSKMNNRIITVSDRGILFDTFKEDIEPVLYTCYNSNQEVFVYSTPTELIVYDTEKDTRVTYGIADIKQIEISNNNEYIGVITKNNELYIVHSGSIIYNTDKVYQISLSNEYAVYSQELTEEEITEIKSLASINIKAPVKEGLSKAPSKPEAETKSALVPENNNQSHGSEGFVAGAKKKGLEKKRPLPKVTVQIQKKEGLLPPSTKKVVPKGLKAFFYNQKTVSNLQLFAPLIWIVINSTLVTGRIFGEKGGELELVDIPSRQRLKKKIVPSLTSLTFVTDKKYNQNRVLSICSTSSNISSYYDTSVLYYLDLDKKEFRTVNVKSPISDAVFVGKSTFIVCYGCSPSKVTVFTNDLEPKTDFPLGVRNKLVFNKQNNLVCMAGINNLPGNMQIIEYSTAKFISENEILGCSVIDWSPNGQNYLVAVTDKMKVDNKVAVFDYYSRKISEQSFKTLKHAQFAGKPTTFIPVTNPPKTVTITQVPDPAAIETFDKNAPLTKTLPAQIIRSKTQIQAEKIKALQKEIKEIEAIEERLSKGQIVPGGMAKIQKKEALLKKLNTFTTSSK
ncbi:translation initiation factor 2A [Nematocida sp. AWRm80]|nr:translation initiation factor 2A [Nematocida sp. AWRm80]